MLSIEKMSYVMENPISDIREFESELVEVLMRGLQGGLFEADMVKLLDGLTENLLEEV